jgi:hypothetical protein
MADYAIIKNGIVQNTIVCGPQDIPAEIPHGISYVEYTVDNPAVIGLGYDGSSFEQMTPSATSSFIANLAEGYDA